jgi:diguanylate cyclase (GGDEF)-like protein/hemerythrin-like metal-binding protein/PAS domain S-box-containing protein
VLTLARIRPTVLLPALEELAVTCKPFRLLRARFGVSLAGAGSDGQRSEREEECGGTRWRGWGALCWLVLAVVLAWGLPVRAEPGLLLAQVFLHDAVTLALALLGGLILLHIHRINRRLRREVQERKTAEAKFRGLVEQSLVGIYIIQDGRFVYVNPKLADIFGYAVEDLVGRLGPLDLTAQADREQVRENLRRRLDGEISSIRYAFSAVRQDGRLIDIEVNGEVVEHEGRPAIVGVALDITEQKRAQRQLNYLAFYDPLTDLPNRTLFFDRLGQTLAQSKRDGVPFALLLLDLDGFKAVNDAHGHETGDALLQAVGRRLRNCVRESDTVARVGGDEFIILLPRLREPNDAARVADKVIESLAEPFALVGHECRVGASIGLCIAPDDGRDMETLLGRADAAMYQSKARGKNTWSWYEATLADGKPFRMAFLEWSEEWSVGVPVIDEQHARMAALLSRIGDAVKTGQREERIVALLDELVTCTRDHFQTEERLMDQHGYANALLHRQAHRKLVEDLLSIQRQFDNTSLMLTLQALKDWLIKHMTESDRRLGEVLIAAGTVESRSEQRSAA